MYCNCLQPTKWASLLILLCFCCTSLRINGQPQPLKDSIKKVSVFLDCNADCDFNYLLSELPMIDFLRDKNAADIHLLINDQRTGGGGKKLEMIFYGQGIYSKIKDTLYIETTAIATDYEERQALLKGIKLGLVPFLRKTAFAKYIDVQFTLPENGITPTTKTKDPWNYWVFRIGTDGSYDIDQVYKSVRASTDVSVRRITEKLRVSFSGEGNYRRTDYKFNDNGTLLQYNVVNKDYRFQNQVVVGLGDHIGLGYESSYSTNSFSNNKRRIHLKAAVEYAVFPYSDLNTRFFTISYGIYTNMNRYFDSTIYFKTSETLLGHNLRADISLNQKWGTLNSSLSYSNYFMDKSLNNLSASISLNVRITGGLSVYLYSYGARVRDQVYLLKGAATEQDVLTRRRQLASDYTLESGLGINFRFGSKLNNFVNPRLKRL